MLLPRPNASTVATLNQSTKETTVVMTTPSAGKVRALVLTRERRGFRGTTARGEVSSSASGSFGGFGTYDGRPVLRYPEQGAPSTLLLLARPGMSTTPRPSSLRDATAHGCFG